MLTESNMLDDQLLGTKQKALKINLNNKIYGSFAEIGAGQEVASIFFKAGGASGTVAKTMSAYDMTFSNAIYGEETSGRYVCESRLLKMFNHEYHLLVERLDQKRGDHTNFFVFANTVVALNYQKTNEGHGWLGVRFQTHPRSTPSNAVIHVKMHDNDAVLQQQAIGIAGVNLLYACYYLQYDTEKFVTSLMDNLSRERIEIDMVRLSGPDFKNIDNRLLSLQLVQHGLTDAALFGPDGHVLQASETFYKRNLLAIRGRFRPLTHVNMDMFKTGYEMFIREQDVDASQSITVAELTLQDLKAADPDIDEKDFLDRVDILCSLGLTVLISNYQQYYKLVGYLSKLTRRKIGIILGVYNLRSVFDEKYYEEDGILKSFSTLFKKNVKLYVYPSKVPGSEEFYTCKNFQLPENLRYLFMHLVANDKIEDIHGYHEEMLHIISDNVLAMIKAGKPGWEEMVPDEVGKKIKENHLFGFAADRKNYDFSDARAIDAVPDYYDPPLW